MIEYREAGTIAHLQSTGSKLILASIQNGWFCFHEHVMIVYDTYTRQKIPEPADCNGPLLLRIIKILDPPINNYTNETALKFGHLQLDPRQKKSIRLLDTVCFGSEKLKRY